MLFSLTFDYNFIIYLHLYYLNINNQINISVIYL
jgi:hypothetical protein